MARERIDDAVRRILRRKVFYATRPDPQAYDERLVRAPEHVALAREAAEKSMVLLKNEGGALPFDQGPGAHPGRPGPPGRRRENLGDHGSSRVYPPDVVTPVEGLREYLGPGARVVHELGTDMARVRQLAREVGRGGGGGRLRSPGRGRAHPAEAARTTGAATAPPGLLTRGGGESSRPCRP